MTKPWSLPLSGLTAISPRVAKACVSDQQPAVSQGHHILRPDEHATLRQRRHLPVGWIYREQPYVWSSKPGLATAMVPGERAMAASQLLGM
jgi:hypothetical protein